MGRLRKTQQFVLSVLTHVKKLSLPTLKKRDRATTIRKVNVARCQTELRCWTHKWLHGGPLRGDFRSTRRRRIRTVEAFMGSEPSNLLKAASLRKNSSFSLSLSAIEDSEPADPPSSSSLAICCAAKGPTYVESTHVAFASLSATIHY